MIGLLLAHGADPTPLDWDEALANIVKLGVTFLVVAVMSYPVLAPLLKPAQEDSEKQAPPPRNELLGWFGVAAFLFLAMGWWLTRTSIAEVMTEESALREDHAHTQVEGGQIAMWGDFHAEVVRIESGEVRVFLSDSYNRPIGARFFQASVAPFTDDETNQPEDFVETLPALDGSYRFALSDREKSSVRVKVGTPGWSVTLKFDFDKEGGRRSLPIWCGTPDGSRPKE